MLGLGLLGACEMNDVNDGKFRHQVVKGVVMN